MSLNDHNGALADFEAALATHPQEPDLLVNRAWELRKRQQCVPASQDLLLVARIDPSDPSLGSWIDTCWPHIVGGAARLTREGRVADARAMVELAEALKPTESQGAPADPKLASLRAAARAPRATFADCKSLDDALFAQNGYPEIVLMWTRYLTDHPNDARAFLERGGALLRLEHAEAVADAKKACAFGLREACAQVTRLEPLPPTK